MENERKRWRDGEMERWRNQEINLSGPCDPFEMTTWKKRKRKRRKREKERDDQKRRRDRQRGKDSSWREGKSQSG